METREVVSRSFFRYARNFGCLDDWMDRNLGLATRDFLDDAFEKLRIEGYPHRFRADFERWNEEAVASFATAFLRDGCPSIKLDVTLTANSCKYFALAMERLDGRESNLRAVTLRWTESSSWFQDLLTTPYRTRLAAHFAALERLEKLVLRKRGVWKEFLSVLARLPSFVRELRCPDLPSDLCAKDDFPRLRRIRCDRVEIGWPIENAENAISYFDYSLGELNSSIPDGCLAFYQRSFFACPESKDLLEVARRLPNFLISLHLLSRQTQLPKLPNLRALSLSAVDDGDRRSVFDSIERGFFPSLRKIAFFTSTRDQYLCVLSDLFRVQK